MFQVLKNQSQQRLAMGFLLGALFLLAHAKAAIIVVNNAGDSGELEGDCSLRDAVLAASINVVVDSCSAGEAGVQDVIVVNVAGPIQLNSAIPVFGSVTIATNIGASRVTIIAGANSRIFRVIPNSYNDSLFSVTNLKLVGGDAGSEDGGAILFSQNNARFEGIEIRDMVFENNQADSGGALAFNQTNADYIEILDSTFINNSAGQIGGAVSGNRLATANVADSNLIISGNLFQSNHANTYAGAVFLTNQGTPGIQAQLNDNVYIANSSGGNAGALALSSIATPQSYEMHRNLWMFNISGGDSGALEVISGSIANVDNAIVAFNQAVTRGGGFKATVDDSLINLKSSTIIHNSAGSAGDNVYISGSGRISLRDSIIAYPINGDNCSGNLNTTAALSTRNMVDNSSCEMLDNATLTFVEDPLLSGFNAEVNHFPGFMPTVNSPALDNGTTFADTDFHGRARPVDGDGDGQAFADLGAVEAAENTDLIWSDGFGF